MLLSLLYLYILTVSRLPAGATRIVLLPLHAGLSTEEQLRIFQPAERGCRKIVISTNIAEVSHPCCGIHFSSDVIALRLALQ